MSLFRVPAVASPLQVGRGAGGMRGNGERLQIIPSEMAYGKQGSRPRVPPTPL